MVGPGEGPLAHPALEWPVSSVLPHVPGQLIRPRKPPAAALPRAQVGLLSCVGSLVGLEVARLGVRLDAAVNGTGVNDLLPFGPCLLPFWLHAIRQRLLGLPSGRGAGWERRRWRGRG